MQNSSPFFNSLEMGYSQRNVKICWENVFLTEDEVCMSLLLKSLIHLHLLSLSIRLPVSSNSRKCCLRCPHTGLCCSSHWCRFPLNVAPFRRELNGLHSRIRFLTKKHCYVEIINQTQIEFISSSQNHVTVQSIFSKLIMILIWFQPFYCLICVKSSASLEGKNRFPNNLCTSTSQEQWEQFSISSHRLKAAAKSVPCGWK